METYQESSDCGKDLRNELKLAREWLTSSYQELLQSVEKRLDQVKQKFAELLKRGEEIDPQNEALKEWHQQQKADDYQSYNPQVVLRCAQTKRELAGKNLAEAQKLLKETETIAASDTRDGKDLDLDTFRKYLQEENMYELNVIVAGLNSLSDEAAKLQDDKKLAYQKCLGIVKKAEEEYQQACAQEKAAKALSTEIQWTLAQYQQECRYLQNIKAKHDIVYFKGTKTNNDAETMKQELLHVQSQKETLVHLLGIGEKKQEIYQNLKKQQELVQEQTKEFQACEDELAALKKTLEEKVLQLQNLKTYLESLMDSKNMSDTIKTELQNAKQAKDIFSCKNVFFVIKIVRNIMSLTQKEADSRLVALKGEDYLKKHKEAKKMIARYQNDDHLAAQSKMIEFQDLIKNLKLLDKFDYLTNFLKKYEKMEVNERILVRRIELDYLQERNNFAAIVGMKENSRSDYGISPADGEEIRIDSEETSLHQLNIVEQLQKSFENAKYQLNEDIKTINDNSDYSSLKDILRMKKDVQELMRKKSLLDAAVKDTTLPQGDSAPLKKSPQDLSHALEALEKQVQSEGLVSLEKLKNVNKDHLYVKAAILYEDALAFTTQYDNLHQKELKKEKRSEEQSKWRKKIQKLCSTYSQNVADVHSVLKNYISEKIDPQIHEKLQMLKNGNEKELKSKLEEPIKKIVEEYDQALELAAKFLHLMPGLKTFVSETLAPEYKEIFTTCLGLLQEFFAKEISGNQTVVNTLQAEYQDHLKTCQEKKQMAENVGRTLTSSQREVQSLQGRINLSHQQEYYYLHKVQAISIKKSKKDTLRISLQDQENSSLQQKEETVKSRRTFIEEQRIRKDAGQEIKIKGNDGKMPFDDLLSAPLPKEVLQSIQQLIKELNVLPQVPILQDHFNVMELALNTKVKIEHLEAMRDCLWKEFSPKDEEKALLWQNALDAEVIRRYGDEVMIQNGHESGVHAYAVIREKGKPPHITSFKKSGDGENNDPFDYKKVLEADKYDPSKIDSFVHELKTTCKDAERQTFFKSINPHLDRIFQANPKAEVEFFVFTGMGNCNACKFVGQWLIKQYKKNGRNVSGSSIYFHSPKKVQKETYQTDYGREGESRKIRTFGRFYQESY